MRGWRILASVALAFLVLGATKDCDDGVAWITPMAPKLRAKFAPLDDASVLPVTGRATAMAVQMLDAGPIMMLDPGALQILAPGAKAPDDATPYLVRAVALDEPLGSVHVLQSGDAILMEYNGPIVSAPSVKRPFVLFLKTRLKTLYVMVRLLG